jgi:hypothetical protein
LFGPAGVQRATSAIAGLRELPGGIDFSRSVIARDPVNRILAWMWLPKPTDGRVTVVATRVPGMADQVTLPVAHNRLMRDAAAQAYVVTVLQTGRFSPCRHNPASSVT